MKKTFLLLTTLLFLLVFDASAQCAMCRATVENNLSNGDIGIGAGLNFGILYLFVMPYLAVAIVGYFWYKNSKGNMKKYGAIRSSN